MANPSTPIASTPKRRFVMPPRRWATLSAICFLAAAYYLCYEHFPVHVTKDTPLYRATRNGKQGVVTAGGRIVVPFEWETIGPFDEHGLAPVVKESSRSHGTSSDPTIDVFVYSSIVGVIDQHGREIIPAMLTDSSWGFDDHGELQGVRDARLINFDRTGREKWRSDWLPANSCSFGKNGLMAVQQGMESGWIDRTGNVVLSPPDGFAAASNFFNCGLAKVRNASGLYGCCDQTGTIVIPPQWEEVDPVYRTFVRGRKRFLELTPFIKVGVRDKDLSHRTLWGLYTERGQLVVPAEYSSLEVHGDIQLILAEQSNGVKGGFDLTGKVKLPFQYSSLSRCDGHRLLRASFNNASQFIHADGKEAFPFAVDDLRVHSMEFVDNRIFAQKHDVWGVIDWQGQTVVPFVYSSICYSPGSEYFAGQKEHGTQVFDMNGRPLGEMTQLKLGQLLDMRRPLPGDNMTPIFSPEQSRLFTASDSNTGTGVFRADRGLIVPLIHLTVELNDSGILGRGNWESSSSFDYWTSSAREMLRGALPTMIPDSIEIEVLYDFDGNVIWRNDARLFDFLKAFGLSCWGVYFIRKYRIAKREQRMLQVA